MRSIKEIYNDLYSKNGSFQNEYKTNRAKLYQSILKIAQDTNVTHCIDIGCSYGLLVELLNKNKIDAFGAELHIDELIEFHKRLPHSKGKFLYGSADEKDFIGSIGERHPNAITIVETLRYLENPRVLQRAEAELLIIREMSDNAKNRKRRAQEFDIRLYSPLDLLQVFSNYECRAVYFFKSLLRVKKPSRFMLRVINAVLPSYTVILKQKRLSLPEVCTDEA